MNSFGFSRNPKTMVKNEKYPVLTATYFKDDAKGTKRVAYPNVNKFFYNKLFNLWCQKEKVDIERRLWTCFKDDAVSIGKGGNKTNRFGASFLAFNKRATNLAASSSEYPFITNNDFLDSFDIFDCNIDKTSDIDKSNLAKFNSYSAI